MAFAKLKEVSNRFAQSLKHRKEIDVILAQVPEPGSLIKHRTDWLFDLIDWIRREGSSKNDLNFTTGAPQAARVRYLLQILDRNQEWKLKVSGTLRSILKESKGLELFIETGLFSQDHFLGELVGRINEKWIPQVPHDDQLSYIFSQNFHEQKDFEWIHLLDDSTFSRFIDLLNFEVGPQEENWNSLKKDCEQALLLLSVQVQGLGLSSDVRKRLSDSHFENSPFYQLPDLIEKFITEPDLKAKKQLNELIQNKLDACHRALTEVKNELGKNGVSLQIVYKTERLKHLIKRMTEILLLLRPDPIDTILLSQFIENLIAENIKKRSLLSFFNQIFALMSRKIVERHAESGEHYITRNSAEYLRSIKSSIGGGLITSLTMIGKILIHHLKIENFFGGVLTSLNYSTSFLAIHFCHFTLGTKQPSSTAPALASQMNFTDNSKALENLTDEIVHTIRSQFAAIFGNIVGVIPATLIICWTYQALTNSDVMSAEESLQIIKSFSLLSMTPIFAAFTGILLWGSSLVSGWIENWITFHKIAEALAANRRISFIIGPHRAKNISLFFNKNILGIASSISLGFLLGLSPVVMHFFGLHLEVRHVTLSTGALTIALFSGPISNLNSFDSWLAVAGVLSMGLINVTVAFTMALVLAIKARNVYAPKRSLIYKSVLRKLYNRPQDFIWPNKK